MRLRSQVVISGLLLLGSVAASDTFRLTNGTEYRNVKLSRVEPDGLLIITDTGIVKLYFADLPEEVRQKYDYDPKKAEAFRFRLDAAKAAAQDEVNAANVKRQQVVAASQPKAAPIAGPTQNKQNLPSLEAHEIGTADGFQSYWETDWGSYDRDYTRGKMILVTIHDLSRKIGRCEINAYFIAHPLFNPNVHFIYDHKRFFPALKGRIEVSGPVNAHDLHARILNLAALGQRYGNGADMDGWIVVGKVENKLFGVRASNQTLLEIAEENPRQTESLTQMIADYDRLNDKGKKSRGEE